jgi:hypothetical protein
VPGPHHAGREPGEEVPLVAVVPQMKMMAVVVAGALPGEKMTALAAAMLAAGECIGRDREPGSSQGKRGNGGGEELGRGSHGCSVS